MGGTVLGRARPPMDRMTDAFENITFPQLRFRDLGSYHSPSGKPGSATVNGVQEPFRPPAPIHNQWKFFRTIGIVLGEAGKPLSR